MNKKKRGTGIIKEGYGTLFQRAYESLPNHEEKLVKSVTATENGQVEVVEENGQKVLFDSVIVACPLPALITPLQGLFKEGSVESTRLFSFLWTSDVAPHFADRMYLMDYINDDKTDVISTLRLWGKTNSGPFLYWGVGYASDSISKESLQQKLEAQVKDELELPASRCDFFEIFDYNVRFSTQAIRDGFHLQVRKAQGKNNIWYSGGMLSHWDVDSIYEFDLNLVQKLIYQNNKSLSNFLKFAASRIRNFIVNI